MPQRSSTGKLVLLIGPSGVGKSVILRKLQKGHSEWHFPRSATTRAQRSGEGEDLYRFVTDEEFDHLLSDGQILEWAVVHGGPLGSDESVRAGARYGTLLQEIVPLIENGKIVIREVDVQGFDSIRTHELFCGDDAPYLLQSIFILPESKTQLIEHITKRAPMEREELDRRLESTEQELTYANLCDVQIINAEGRIADAVSAVEKAITALPGAQS